MQKIKKSLENNILKINLNKTGYPFILENIAEKKLEKISCRSRVLTNSSIKNISLDSVASSQSLKFPLILKTFKVSGDLRNYFITNLADQKFVPILIKVQNYVYKKETFITLMSENSFSKMNNLKCSLFSILTLIKILKSHNMT